MVSNAQQLPEYCRRLAVTVSVFTAVYLLYVCTKYFSAE